MCMSVNRVFPPILHMLMELGNDIYSKFKEHAHSRIENQSQEEIEDKKSSLVAELKDDEGLVKLDVLKN